MSAEQRRRPVPGGGCGKPRTTTWGTPFPQGQPSAARSRRAPVPLGRPPSPSLITGQPLPAGSTRSVAGPASRPAPSDQFGHSGQGPTRTSPDAWLGWPLLGTVGLEIKSTQES